jgi:MFS family permease
MSRPERTDLAQPNTAPPLGPEHASPWSPLRQPVFRALWIASVVSNVGTWMQNVGAAWLMTLLTPSAIVVALVQAATSLPVFLVALPAGALADVVDRRRLLLLTQGWMLLAATALGIVTMLGAMTPMILLALTFALGLGAAMNGPVWQAVVPELVRPAELQEAVALNGAGFNVARAVGPALGGVIVAAAGPAPVFLLNAASFIVVIFVIYRWQRQSRASRLPAEHVIGAIRAGIRYVRHAPAFQVVLVRSGVFILCGAAPWALLPLVARDQLGLGAVGYGVLLGCLGIGAIIGSAFLPKLKEKLSLDALVVAAIVLFGGTTLVLAYARDVYLVGAAMVAGGVAWIALMASFNAAAQKTAPEWVRGRALAVYLLVFQGGTAAGSVFWGAVATSVGIPTSLLLAAFGIVAGLVMAKRYRLASGEKVDLTPSLHWPEPHVVVEPKPGQGPVLVFVEYLIEAKHEDDFIKAMRELRQERLRDGAMRWGLFGDPAHPRRYIETFLVESWLEHMRQHERVTRSDRQAQEVVRAFYIDDKPPEVSHFIHVS